MLQSASAAGWHAALAWPAATAGRGSSAPRGEKTPAVPARAWPYTQSWLQAGRGAPHTLCRNTSPLCGEGGKQQGSVREPCLSSTCGVSLGSSLVETLLPPAPKSESAAGSWLTTALQAGWSRRGEPRAVSGCNPALAASARGCRALN